MSRLHRLRPSQPSFGVISLALITSVVATVCFGQHAARPPNVVVFLADDQGWGDLGATGNTNLRTPHIDSLAHDGATFDHFYVCPVCAPTRAEFLTGRYYLRTGVRGVGNGDARLNLDERTIADAFKAAGYATGAFGKWHNGTQWPYHPTARGFEEFYGFTSGHLGAYFDAPLDHNGAPARGRGYIADDLTNRALEFIERNRHRPFFCYVPFNTPHSPFSVPDEYWQRFESAPIALRGPDGARENLAVTRCVLAMTENLDWNVGRVLRRLDELQLTRDTIVVYFSDNGPNSSRWNGGMKGRKTSTDEGGVRVPCFVRWPGRIARGLTVREIAGGIDLLPTLAQLAGVPLVGAKRLDGRDLSPLLLQTPLERDWPDRMIFSHWNSRASVRTPRHRLDYEGKLYDMEADPRQETDIARGQPDVAARLAQALAAWRMEVAAAPSAADLPFTVGHAELPRAELSAGDSVLHGGIRRSNRFPNSSYLTHWTSLDDAIAWPIDVHQTGEYVVELSYTCSEPDAGSTIEARFNGAILPGEVTPAWDPPLLDREDRVARQESYLKDFRTLRLGIIRLEAGRGEFTLRATRISGAQVMDLFTVALVLSPPRDAP